MNDTIENIKAKLRAEFINVLDSMKVEHKVSVNQKMAEGGKIDYQKDSEGVSIKSAKMTRKQDKDTGGVFYELKVVVD